LIHAVEVAIESIHVSGPEQAERSLPQLVALGGALASSAPFD